MCNLLKQNVWPTEKQCLKVSDIVFPAMYTLSEVVFSKGRREVDIELTW